MAPYDMCEITNSNRPQDAQVNKIIFFMFLLKLRCILPTFTMLPSFWAYAHLYVFNFSLYTNIRTHDFSETIMVLGEGAQAPQMPPWAPRTIKCF